MVKNLRQVLVAMIGARRHYSVPRALHEGGVLERFYTDLCADVGVLRGIASVVPPPLIGENFKKMLGRHVAGVPADKITSFTAFGLRRTLRARRTKSPDRRVRAYADWNAEFGRLVVGSWPSEADGVYVFNGAGLEIMEHAADRGATRILDQTAAPWAVEESTLAEERKRWPGWDYEGATRADWMPMAEREQREWSLADTIICGSPYVLESIRTLMGPCKKCVVVPYGISAGSLRAGGRERREGPLRVLFAGTVQLRKGIQYVMEAAKVLDPKAFVFRAVGPIRVAQKGVYALEQHVELAGYMSRVSLEKQYEWADVLVLPSVSEGSANVCYEALAAGLPVITTSHAGSVVRDGMDGFVVPIRSAGAIAAKLGMMEAKRDMLQEMSQSALQRARAFTFQNYAENLVAAVTRGATGEG